MGLFFLVMSQIFALLPPAAFPARPRGKGYAHVFNFALGDGGFMGQDLLESHNH